MVSIGYLLVCQVAVALAHAQKGVPLVAMEAPPPLGAPMSMAPRVLLAVGKVQEVDQAVLAPKMTSFRAVVFFFSSFRFMRLANLVGHFTMRGWPGQPMPYRGLAELLAAHGHLPQLGQGVFGHVHRAVGGVLPKGPLRKVSTPLCFHTA